VAVDFAARRGRIIHCFVHVSWCIAEKLATRAVGFWKLHSYFGDFLHFLGYLLWCVHIVGVGNGSLKVDDADKGYTGGPKEREQLC